MNVMDEAAALIYGNRRHAYGRASKSFGTIAGLWTTYLRGRGLLAEGAELETTDAAAILLLLKVSRHATGGTKRDTIVDLVGYAALMAECAGLDDDHEPEEFKEEGDAAPDAAPGTSASIPAGEGEPASSPLFDEADDMCPNCVTLWKCNGPFHDDGLQEMFT